MDTRSIAILGTITITLIIADGSLSATTCMSSNYGTGNWDDDGVETTCSDVAGATLRYCLKFNSATRSGKVYRECDHVYEDLFGNETFLHTGEGCWNYETQIGDITEKGMFCACNTDNCNSGTVPDEDLIAGMARK